MVDRGKKKRVFFRRKRRFIILDGESTLVERVFIKLPWITFVLAGFSLLGESIFNQVLIPRSILISSLRYYITNVYIRREESNVIEPRKLFELFSLLARLRSSFKYDSFLILNSEYLEIFLSRVN